MTRRNIRLVIQAAVIGLVASLAFSRDQLVSVRIWIGVAIVWVVLAHLVRMLNSAGIEPATLHVLWRRASRSREPDRRPSELRGIEVLLSTAIESPRANAFRLQPRLRRLAQHSFRVGNGIDLDRDPDRVRAALGDVAWLIDATANDPSPTLAELERFLDRLEGAAASASNTTTSGEQ